MLTKEQWDKGNAEQYSKLTIEMINEALRKMFSEDILKPYKDIGNGLYELPGCIITNKIRLKKYLKRLANEADKL